MKPLFLITIIFASLVIAFGLRAQDQPPLKAIVYIVCEFDGKVIKGTGVVASADGKVVTAKHVAPDNSVCKASIGTAAQLPDRQLYFLPQKAPVDATLLRMLPAPGESFEHIDFCKPDVTTAIHGNDIRAIGFPDGGTGEASIVDGQISTTFSDAKGLIRTTAPTSEGMSGGPVLMTKNAQAVGIADGSDFSDKTAAITTYQVLTAENFVEDLHLKFSSTPCESDADQLISPLPVPDEPLPSVADSVQVAEVDPLEGIKLVYFEKDADNGEIETLLGNEKLTFEKRQGENDYRTNLITCSKDTPPEVFRRVAHLLVENGFPIFNIRRNPAETLTKQLNIESEKFANSEPMTLAEIDSVTSCDYRPSKLKSVALKIQNACPEAIRAFVRFTDDDYGENAIADQGWLKPYTTSQVQDANGYVVRLKKPHFYLYAFTNYDDSGKRRTWSDSEGPTFRLPNGEKARFQTVTTSQPKIVCSQ